MFYYKIKNDLSGKKVTYEQCKFSFETLKEEVMQSVEEQADYPVCFVVFAHQAIQHKNVQIVDESNAT